MIKLSRRAMLAGLVIGTTGLLAGCGFKLRGTGEIAQANYQTVKLVGEEAAPPTLIEALKQSFQGQGVRLTESMAEADLLIELAGYERHISRTAFSTTGDTTAELVKLSQGFRVQRVMDERLILDSRVQITRDRRINPNQLLASARELEDMERQMQQDLARQLIDRINRATRRLDEVVQP